MFPLKVGIILGFYHLFIGMHLKSGGWTLAVNVFKRLQTITNETKYFPTE